MTTAAPAGTRRLGGAVPMTEETIALIYSRVSTDEQGDEGVSLPAQVGECRRYNNRQPGWIAGEEFQDVESGRRDDRDDYQRLLMTARGYALAGRRVALTTASLDRLGRSVAERVRAYEELKALGIAIHSAREGGIVSEFTYNILAAVAQEESRKLGERVRASSRYVNERGWHTVGRTPWGYRWRPATPEERSEGSPLKVLEPHSVEATYVREAWQRVAEGESLQSLARWAASLPSEARGGRNLRFTIIRPLLRAPVYIGRLGARDGDLSDVLSLPVGRWEPLISDEVWTQAQAQLDMARRMPRQASGKFPLTGLIRCFRCGSRMGGRTNHNTPSRRRRTPIREYVCTGWADGAKNAGPKCTAVVPAKSVEAAVLETVGELLTAVDRPKVRDHARRAWAERERSARADDDVKRITALEQQLKTTRKRISAASVKFLDGDLDREAYDIVRADLAHDLKAAETELERLRGRVKPVALPPMDAVLAGVGGWAAVMQKAAPAPVRQALGVLVERLEPVRVGFGKYEARIDWSPIGWALLGTALQVAPSENLIHVECFAQP
jgi:site-specific DNA recombinase